MTDSRTPQLLGITLDSNGVAYTQVVALNRSTGERQIKPTDGSKVVIFDAADFDTLYVNEQVIAFENVGASHGGTTITINTASGFQEATITCAAAPTGNMSL